MTNSKRELFDALGRVISQITQLVLKGSKPIYCINGGRLKAKRSDFLVVPWVETKTRKEQQKKRQQGRRGRLPPLAKRAELALGRELGRVVSCFSQFVNAGSREPKLKLGFLIVGSRCFGRCGSHYRR
jgi:hypothetical protein